jgi:hypothetical protein
MDFLFGRDLVASGILEDFPKGYEEAPLIVFRAELK